MKKPAPVVDHDPPVVLPGDLQVRLAEDHEQVGRARLLQ